MGERYERIFLSNEEYYMEKSPVVYVAGGLLKDSKYKRVVAQLKFRNISSKVIRAAKIEICAKDSFGKKLDGVSEFSYTDLNVAPGTEWGQETAMTYAKELSEMKYKDSKKIYNKLLEEQEAYMKIVAEEMEKRYAD